MSKPVRLPNYLHEKVEQLAKEERRSVANMVALLLEKALESGAAMDRPVPMRDGSGSRIEKGEPAVAPDPHFKPDFK